MYDMKLYSCMWFVNTLNLSLQFVMILLFDITINLYAEYQVTDGMAIVQNE